MARRSDPVGRATDLLIGFAGRMILLALLVFALFKAAGWSYSFGHALLYAHGMEAAPGREVTVHVPEEARDSGAVAEVLLQDKLIDNKYAFMLQSRLYEATLLPGDYELNTAMTIPEILQAMTEEGVKKRELSEKGLSSGDERSEGRGQTETPDEAGAQDREDGAGASNAAGRDAAAGQAGAGASGAR